MELRIGLGFDSHEFAEGKKLVLGGVEIPFEYGLKGHSDGDALLHAITDAILGALGERDIGEIFKDTDLRWKGASSEVFLREALRLMEEKGFGIQNLDCVIIADKPKISPYKERIRERLSELLNIDKEKVSLKGKSMCVILLIKS